MRCGVDGFKGGWIAAIDDGVDVVRVEAFHDLAALIEVVGTDGVIAIDIPIGLPARGARQCDVEARRLMMHSSTDTAECDAYAPPTRRHRASPFRAPKPHQP